MVGELLESATLIKNYLLYSDDLDLDISEFRPELMLPNRYEVWLNDIWKRIHQLKPYKRKRQKFIIQFQLLAPSGKSVPHMKINNRPART